MLRTLLQPRALLLLMMGVGALGLAVVMLGAAFDRTDRPWEADAEPLLVGEMADVAVRDLRRPAPDLMLTDAGGEAEPVLLSQLVTSGRPTLVNLWASWCAPCLEELPSLMALAEGSPARVVPVAMEPVSPAIAAAAERAGVAGAFPLWADPDLGALRAYGTGLQLPTTILYDADGREVARLTGAADWASPEAVRLMAAIGEGRTLR